MSASVVGTGTKAFVTSIKMHAYILAASHCFSSSLFPPPPPPPPPSPFVHTRTHLPQRTRRECQDCRLWLCNTVPESGKGATAAPQMRHPTICRARGPTLRDRDRGRDRDRERERLCACVHIRVAKSGPPPRCLSCSLLACASSLLIRITAAVSLQVLTEYYEGATVDLWSLGVIVVAMLAGCAYVAPQNGVERGRAQHA